MKKYSGSSYKVDQDFKFRKKCPLTFRRAYTALHPSWMPVRVQSAIDGQTRFNQLHCLILNSGTIAKLGGLFGFFFVSFGLVSFFVCFVF